MEKNKQCGSSGEERAVNVYRCVVQRGKAPSLPEKAMQACVGKIAVYVGDRKIKLFSEADYEAFLERVRNLPRGERYLRVICEHAVCVEDEEELFFAILRACQSENRAVSDQSVFHMTLTVTNGEAEIRFEE